MKSKSMTAVESGQSRFRLGKVIFGIVLLGLVLVGIGIQRQRAPQPSATDSVIQPTVPAAQHTAARTPAQNLKTGRTPAAADTVRPLTPSHTEDPAAAQMAGSPVARQLLAGLTQFNPG